METKNYFIVQYNDKFGDGNNTTFECIVKDKNDFIKWLKKHNEEREADGNEPEGEEEFSLIPIGLANLKADLFFNSAPVSRNPLTMDYNVYLFSCLVKLYDKSFASQPYDIQFDVIHGYYHQFELSEFNTEDKGLYECIIDYLKHHFDNNTIGFKGNY